MVRLAFVGLAVLGVGCDRLPWEQKPPKPAAKDSAQAASSATGVRLTDPGVLALVNKLPIREDFFRRRAEALPDDTTQGFATTYGQVRVVHRKPKTLEERKIFLEELVKEELMVQDAVAAGLERDPDVRQQLEDSRRLILITAAARQDVKRVSVTDQDVEDFYKRYKEAYKDPERIHVSQVVLKTLEEAEATRTYLVQGANFAQVAQERSVGPGKEASGDIGWYIKLLDYQLLTGINGQSPADVKPFFPQLEAVAFSLEPNQISQPVKGPDGHYYLVRLEERKAERIRSLSELMDKLRTGLISQKQQESVQDHLARVWQKGDIKLNEQRLEHL